MALVLADRVKDSTTSTSTGTITLSGTAPSGYQNFSAVGDGSTTYYTIAGVTVATEWEVGIGTYTASGTTLSRDTVLSSSAGGTTKVSFSAGTKDVFVTYPAERSVNLSSSGLTSGRVPYATTNGLLTDTSTFAFSGTVLTYPTPFTLGATSVTSTGTQLNYLNAATGTTGTTSSSLVFSASPTFTGTSNFAASGITLLGSSTGKTTFASANAGASNYTITFPAATDTLAGLTATAQAFSGGIRVTSFSIGTPTNGSTTTLDSGNGPLQYMTNNVAGLTIAAPANDGNLVLYILNGASAGTVTWSGFTVGSSTGDALTTTNTSKFMVSITRINSISTYIIKALQ